ncbi:response regulator [bacterium]|nr:response regulator [bacterium]
MSHGPKKPARVLAKEKSPDAQTILAGLDQMLQNHNPQLFAQTKIQSPRIPILIVEDQALMRKAYKRVLEPTQMFSIQDTQTPKDAIQYLRNHAIDLVILDLYLNKGSGLEVLNYIRSRPIANDIPVVFVSGEASRDDIVHAIELGVNDYIIKPFEPQDLLFKIRQVLARYVDPPANLQRLRNAENLLLQGQLGESHQEFLALRAIEPESPRVIVGLAHAEWKFANIAAAKNLLEEAIRISDMCFPAYALMADILLQEGKKHEAIEFLLRELSLNGKRAGRRVQLADVYFDLHDYRSGLEQMRLALCDFPNDEALLLKMASLQMEIGDSEKSLHYYLKTRRNVPRSNLSLKGISDVCGKLKNNKKALQIFTDFLNQKPQQADVLLARALVHEKMEMFDEALADVEASLICEPDQTEAMTSKGRLLKRLGQEMPARMIWASLTRIDPSAESMFQVGMINFNAGDFAQAALYFERSIFAEANHAKSLYHLALSYRKLAQFGKAKAVCQQALALLPQNGEFKKLLEELSGHKAAGKKADSASLPKKAG